MSSNTAVLIDIAGDTYELVKSSDVIAADSKKGTKFWQAHVVRDATGEFYTCSSAWHTTKDGLSKKVWSKPYYATPTNEGRANSRGNEAQAYFEYDSMINKQTDKRLSEKPLPMLAQPYAKRKAKLTFPAFIQPKFDGMRVLYNGEEAWSRGNKPIIAEVFAHLHFHVDGNIIDGELILPENVKVNETMSAAKKFRAGISDKLLYRVYDIVDESLPYESRYALLQKIVAACGNPNIVLAETQFIENSDDVDRWHKTFTDQGFEGSIIRTRDGKYAINKRSDDLLKHKDFIDEEFEIIDIIPAGGGSSAEVGKFVCKSPANATKPTFESTATGDEAQRRDYLVNKQKYIGKFAKVKFREFTAYGQPFHSNVLEIRDTKEGGY